MMHSSMQEESDMVLLEEKILIEVVVILVSFKAEYFTDKCLCDCHVMLSWCGILMS